jgi:formamidopyrimidine-DNA glycosylase
VPELPEVETVRRGLLPAMEGRVILAAAINRPDLRWPLPERMAARLTGARVLALRRRSKYILADLSSGETLLIHLGMSGRMLVSGSLQGSFRHDLPAPQKHDHVVLDMEGGARVTFNDARRFGAMDLTATEGEPHRLLKGLGPEPFGNDFNEAYLVARLRGRAAPVKALLLDQRVLAGLGNIYVCEALFRAGIAPERAGGSLGDGDAARLVAAISAVLTEAIAAGGSTLRDYRRLSGDGGWFQHDFAVYGRAGEPCSACARPVARIVQNARSTFWCPRCQH